MDHYKEYSEHDYFKGILLFVMSILLIKFQRNSYEYIYCTLIVMATSPLNVFSISIDEKDSQLMEILCFGDDVEVK